MSNKSKTFMNDIKIFAEFIKRDDDQRIVTGYASTPTLDSQDEIVEKDAIANALSGYLGEWDEKNNRWRFGGLREMHQLSAVGKTLKAMIDDKGLYVEGKVVDDNAWKKVKEGVYAGFSIGGKILNQIKNRIKALKLTEISLVDRPANPDAVFEMVKIDEKGKITDMQEESFKAESLFGLAKDLRFLLNAFEDQGKSTLELSRALDVLKDLAKEVLSSEDKQEFERILYGIDFIELDKAKLPFRSRKDMPKGQFAYIDSKGGKHLPIHDKAHARNAMARFNQTQFESPEKRRSAARRIIAAARRFGIEIDPNSTVARAAKKIDYQTDLKKFIDTNWTTSYFEDLKKVLG